MKRVCRQPSCTTILSSYNPDPKCFIHAVPHFGPGMGLRERQRRQEELDGLHPEVLKHVDQPMGEVERFQRYRLSLEGREPRDLMEA